MSFNSLLIHLVDITNVVESANPAEVNRYGDPDETPTTTDDVPCRIDPAGGQETLTPNRDTRVTRFRIFFKADAPVTALSVLAWEGRTLRVSAEPERLYNAVMGHHLEVDAEEVLG